MESTRVTTQAADSNLNDTLNKSKLRLVVDVNLAADLDDIYAASSATFLPADKDILDTPLNITVREASRRKHEDPKQSISSRTTRSYASSLVSRSSLATFVDADLDAELDDVYASSRASCSPLDKDALETLNTSLREVSQHKLEARSQYFSSKVARPYASSTVNRLSDVVHVGEDLDAYPDDVYVASRGSFSPVDTNLPDTLNMNVRGASNRTYEDSCPSPVSYASSGTSRVSLLAKVHEVNTDAVDALTANVSLSTPNTVRGPSPSIRSCQTSSTEPSSLEHRAHGGLLERQHRLRQNQKSILSALALKKELAQQEFENTAVNEYERELEKALEARGRKPKQHKTVTRIPRLKEVAEI